MSDEELDRARAKEAERVTRPHTCQAVAQAAARLGRQGWTPPDPLEAEIKTLCTFYENHTDDSSAFIDVLRKALERGIEIGRNREGAESVIVARGGASCHLTEADVVEIVRKAIRHGVIGGQR